MHKSFTIEFSKILIQNLFNDYTDNHNTFRFGPAKPEAKNNSLKSIIKKKLNEKKYFSVPPPIETVTKALEAFGSNMNYFEYLYNQLNDDYSRELLLKVCAFRVMGKRKIKLPMNNPEFWSKIPYIENTLADKNDSIDTISFWTKHLYMYDIAELGYPIKMYFKATDIYYNFVYKCYFYKQPGVDISVKEGDYVIDAGACYGDTALFFAHHAGPTGKVYSFEFVPENLTILEKNIALNPNLKDRINIIKLPIWSKKGVPVYFEAAQGPGTKLSMDKFSETANVVQTTTIDQLVADGKIEKVDFIKMDIEGAEVDSLKGAENTIKKFKPKLAISLYHRISDFKVIAEYLKSLDVGYKFYFNHYTMHIEESVLFCIA